MLMAEATIRSRLLRGGLEGAFWAWPVLALSTAKDIMTGLTIVRNLLSQIYAFALRRYTVSWRFPKSEEDMFPTDVVIVAGARTPMARYTGAFSEMSAIDL